MTPAAVIPFASEPLLFEPDGHRYSVGGRVLPSVTTVLQDQGLIDSEWFTDDARDRGTRVHLASRMLDDDELDEDSIDESIAPYVTAYRKFLALTQPEWIYIEHRVFDLQHWYAGTLDRAGIVNGVRMLIDIKTGGFPKSSGPQTAAYKRRLPDAHTWKRAALQLKADETFVLHPLTERSDEAVFLAALSVYGWKQRNLR
jgi:hypothetical protein